MRWSATAIEHGLDPATPAVAVSRATRADQASISAPVSLLAARVEVAELPGPVLVMIGKVFSAVEERSATNAHSPGADAQVNSGSIAFREPFTAGIREPSSVLFR